MRTAAEEGWRSDEAQAASSVLDAQAFCNDDDITLWYDASMPMSRHQTAPKRDSLNLRISPVERALIDQAAQLTGKTRTDFVLEAARRAAEEALLDRTLFTLSPDAFASFLARLDAPPQPDERLRRLMQTPAPWERG